ncbi:MAG: DUF305 domain-containing protein [Acidimicrobiales bacterium]|nr:DUF305 domain-containing protein [Acidimicrobiales bacterium]
MARNPTGDQAAILGNVADRSPHNRRRMSAIALFIALLALAAGAGYLVGRSQDGIRPVARDTGFVVDMLDHHQQAVELAEFAQAQTTNDVVRSLALSIISDQRWEIGWMEAWLADRGVPRPNGSRTAMAWMDMPVPSDQMPGLIPSEEVIDFYNQTGDNLDRTFLELMLRHHEGGVHMAQYAAQHAADPALREFASRIVVKQRNEMNDITQLLG